MEERLGPWDVQPDEVGGIVVIQQWRLAYTTGSSPRRTSRSVRRITQEHVQPQEPSVSGTDEPCDVDEKREMWSGPADEMRRAAGDCLAGSHQLQPLAGSDAAGRQRLAHSHPIEQPAFAERDWPGARKIRQDQARSGKAEARAGQGKTQVPSTFNL